VAYNIRNYWVSGLCPSSEYYKTKRFVTTGSVPSSGEGRAVLDLLEELTSITVQPMFQVSNYVATVLVSGLPSVTHDQIFITVGHLQSSCYGTPSLTRGSIMYLYNSKSLSCPSPAELMTHDSPNLVKLKSSQSHITSDGQSVSMSWCRAQSGTFDQRFFFSKVTVLSFWGALSDERSGLSCVSLCHWSLQ
jgi:hypothetical protein